ncbi:MAG: transcriptional regulator [Clostridiales bacterium]|jgi:putative transcriptional regulator|nr:transcriptional regulator [Clostridiales bacterium]
MDKKLFNDLTDALNEAVAHAKGEIECKTTRITAAPLPDFDAERIKKVRSDLRMTQGIFATMLGVSKRTVESWEHGTNKPSGPACRLLAMAEQDKQLPEHYNIITRSQENSRA